MSAALPAPLAALQERLMSGAEITPDEVALVMQPEHIWVALGAFIEAGVPTPAMKTLIDTYLEDGTTSMIMYMHGSMIFQAQRKDVFDLVWQHDIPLYQSGVRNLQAFSLAENLGEHGWTDQVEALLGLRRPGCNLTCKSSQTACICAAVHMLASGALAGAVRGNHCELVRALMARPGMSGKAALATAASCGSMDAFRVLAEEFGMSVKGGKDNMSYLSQAICYGHVAIAEYIRTSTDVDPQPDYWNTEVASGVGGLLCRFSERPDVFKTTLRYCAAVGSLILYGNGIEIVCQNDDIFNVVRPLNVIFQSDRAASIICNNASWPVFEWAAPRLPAPDKTWVCWALRNRDAAILAHLVDNLGMDLPENAMTVAQDVQSGAVLNFLEARGLHPDFSRVTRRQRLRQAMAAMAPAAFEFFARGTPYGNRFFLSGSGRRIMRLTPATSRELSQAGFDMIVVGVDISVEALAHWLPSASPVLEALVVPPLTAQERAVLEPALARSAVHRLLLKDEAHAVGGDYPEVDPQPPALVGRCAIRTAGSWSPDVHARYPPELRAIIVALLVLARSQPSLRGGRLMELLARAIGRLNWWA